MLEMLKEVIWASKTLLSKERGNQIRECLVDEKVDFKYVETIDELEDLLEHIQKKKISCNENSLGQNIELDHLILLDNVSVHPDRSKYLQSF